MWMDSLGREASWMTSLWTTIMDGSIVDDCVVYGFIINALFIRNLKLDRCLHRPCPHRRCQHILLWTITLHLHLLNHSLLCMIAVLTHSISRTILKPLPKGLKNNGRSFQNMINMEIYSVNKKRAISLPIIFGITSRHIPLPK